MGFQKLLLASHLFKGFDPLGQRCFIEQRKQRGQTVTVYQTEDFNIGLRNRAPAGDVQGALGLGKKAVSARSFTIIQLGECRRPS